MPDLAVSTVDDAPLAGTVLAEAFAEDPVMNWIFPAVADRATALIPWFVLAAEVAVRRSSAWEVRVHGEVQGVAVWVPPGVDGVVDEATRPAFVAVSADLGGDDALARMGAVGALTHEHHPSQRHWYLFLAGVRPSAQGRGLGADLLGPVLARADRDSVGSHLESSNPRNVAFYERLRYRVVATFSPRRADPSSHVAPTSDPTT